MILKAEGADRQDAAPPAERWRARAAGADAVGKGFVTPRDLLIVSIVSVLFAFLTFTNLGSTKAPQQGFSFLEEGETAVLDLGQEKDFRLLYYQGIHYANSTFTVETAGEDGQFGEISSAPVNYGDCFKWSYVKEPGKGDAPTEFTGR